MRKLVSLAIAVLTATLSTGTQVWAEQAQLRIAHQYGLLFLPLIIMDEQRLVQKHIRAAGLADVEVSYQQIAGGNTMNDGLISGSIDIASGGVPPFLTLWARTRSSIDVRAVTAMDSMPLYLNTRDPNLRTIRDVSSRNKIALPAVKVSIQSIVLQMAADKTFGPTEYAKLDAFTVALPHPMAMSLLLSGQGEIDCHFAAPPYNYEEVEHSGIHTILNSYDILGPATFEIVWSTRKFIESNPKLLSAFYAGFDEAIRIINEEPERAAEIYLKQSKDKITKEQVVKILKDPQVEFSTVPKGLQLYVDFLYRIGSLKVKPVNEDELFFARPN